MSILTLICAVLPEYMGEIEKLARDVLSLFDVLRQDATTIDEKTVAGSFSLSKLIALSSHRL